MRPHVKPDPDYQLMVGMVERLSRENGQLRMLCEYLYGRLGACGKLDGTTNNMYGIAMKGGRE